MQGLTSCTEPSPKIGIIRIELTLSKRQDSSERIQEDLKEFRKDPPLLAMHASATEAALRVAQSLLLRASWMLVIAVDKACSVEAPPA